MHQLDAFCEIWTCDFEYMGEPGERSCPVCMVAHELRRNRKLKLWRSDFGPLPPFSIGSDSLFVAYFASAELGCFLSLGWPMPVRILDLFVEFRVLTNGWPTAAGNSLLGAFTYFGRDGIKVSEKAEMRDLILGGGPWSPEKQDAILGYCESDTTGLADLLLCMIPHIDLPRALYRGRYMAAVAAMEFEGVPLDVELLEQLRRNWSRIQDALIARIDRNYGVYDGRTFKYERFERWLIQNRIAWSRLESGRLDLGDKTFREMSKIHPAISPLRELRHALSEMRLNDLAVGSDGRNRCLLSPFGARSGRNTPSNTKFIFGPSVWLRHLIKPPQGYGLAYIDWMHQEFGIAAVLSQDPAMLAAYESGDPYLVFAQQAGVVPPEATKETHPIQRECSKQCVLGTQYGMGYKSLALRIGQSDIAARHLLELNREVYRKFWDWSDNILDLAMLYGWQMTVFGWTKRIPLIPNPRSIRNFPMQAHGAEILRLAACLGTENGIRICAPVHDAFLICSPLETLEQDVARMRQYMAEASRIVLGGVELESEFKLVRYPDHYCDPRGERMWSEVTNLLCQIQNPSTLSTPRTYKSTLN